MMIDSAAQTQPESGYHALLTQNQHTLAQVLEVLEQVPMAIYTRSYAPVNSSMGTHVRHVLEFYRLFLCGCAEGPISYERRRRDPALEQDPVRIRTETQGLLDGLAQLKTDRPVLVEHCDRTLARSSVLRELQFLVDHATHHLAMVNIIGALAGVALPEALGVAQATLAYTATDLHRDDPTTAYS
ncbi:MAG: DinB family protein [Pseudomonadota bacterium]